MLPGVAIPAVKPSDDLSEHKREAAIKLHERLREEAKQYARLDVACPTLLNLDSLGSGRPDRLTHTSNSSGASGAEDASSSSSTSSAESIGENSSDKPFACAVRIVVRGQTVEQALEQGKATVREVQASLVRGPVATSTKKLMPGSQHYVLWTNLGPRNSLRVQPEKSNSIVWLNKADAAMSEFDPKNPWPVQRALIEKELPHARSWVDVLEHAREDGGIDIKDDCRLEDRSARLHQDGNNFMKRGARPLVRLAINVSSASSGRSLDYLELSAMEKGFVDGAERDELLVFSVSQDQMWHGAAQTTSGYVQGISEVCHCSSAGQGRASSASSLSLRCPTSTRSVRSPPCSGCSGLALKSTPLSNAISLGAPGQAVVMSHVTSVSHSKSEVALAD